MFSKQAKLESYYKCYNWIRLTFLSGARNAPIIREKNGTSADFFFSFLTDDSIHKKLFFSHILILVVPMEMIFCVFLRGQSDAQV